jgi:hypothetical protein
MDLSRRLERLEQIVQPTGGRCPVCRDWPPHRVVWPDGSTSREMHWRGKLVAPPPERCPACGWCPLTIQVVYDEGPEAPLTAREATRDLS